MVPSKSAGSKSGVNWTLLKSTFITFDKVLIARVFASPGTPSRSMCPLERSPIRRLSTICF